MVLTGAPPGVGQIRDGQILRTEISRLGQMTLPVRVAGAPTPIPRSTSAPVQTSVPDAAVAR